MAEKPDEELATKDNVKPLIEKGFRTLISKYKEMLLEALDKLEERYQSAEPETMPICRAILNDVRKIIIAAKK